MITQRAQAHWQGGLKDGAGSFRAGSVAGRYSYSSRFEGGSGSTPEELIGAAHASCFSMALALVLGEHGLSPVAIDTTATVYLDPDRLAIRTKLLEVYAKRRDTKGFELLATQLYALTKGEGDDWAKAQELGRGIDPENPLYKPGGQPVAAVAGDGGRIIEPLGASTMPQSIMPHTSGFPTSAIDSMPARKISPM